MGDVIANQPIVIDNGSGMIKAGFAGDASPKVKFYNYVGRPKHTRCMAGAVEGDLFIGEFYILIHYFVYLIFLFRIESPDVERFAGDQLSYGTWNCY